MILLLGHMRSYSTLLSHQLGSHPEISGYAELHKSYPYLKPRSNDNYKLDKILHNQYIVSEDVLKNSHLIITVREPEDTIKSIVRLGYKLNINWFKNQYLALNYYLDRLKKLKEIALKHPHLLIKAEDIIKDTDVLKDIKDFLQLKSDIKKDYSIFELTGKRWHGDSTDEIRTGKVQPKRENNIVLDKNVIEIAKEGYSLFAIDFKTPPP